MRLGSVILVVWLIIGAIAGGQRGYYKNTPNCGGAGTIAVTILAGPLNYAGACNLEGLLRILRGRLARLPCK